MEKNHGIRFSSDAYCTKEEVKLALNMTSVDSIWEEIKIYRSYYLNQLNLRNIEKIPYSLCVTPKLSYTLISLEKRLSKLELKYKMESLKNKDLYGEINFTSYTNILSTLKDIYGINVDINLLSSLISGTYPNMPLEYLVLKRYLDTLIYFKSKSSSPINQQLLCLIYTKLRGIEIDYSSMNSYYRKEDIDEIKDHVFMGKHYEGCPKDSIGECMNSLFEYLSNNNELNITNALIAYYYILYIKPFDYFNEEVALILFKFVLGHDFIEDLAFIINFESLLEDSLMKKLSSSMLESELQLDLTYFIYHYLPYINEKVNIISSLIDEISSKEISNELNNICSTEEEIINKERYIKPYSVDEAYYQNKTNSSSQLEYEQKVSLPVMPVGLDEQDASVVASHLLELYPTLRRSQAEFYSHHCTLGKYYSINQFKEYASCAYETARTSMDNLASLGFYKKENVKNKFVYTPIKNKKGEE